VNKSKSQSQKKNGWLKNCLTGRKTYDTPCEYRASF